MEHNGKKSKKLSGCPHFGPDFPIGSLQLAEWSLNWRGKLVFPLIVCWQMSFCMQCRTCTLCVLWGPPASTLRLLHSVYSSSSHRVQWWLQIRSRTRQRAGVLCSLWYQISSFKIWFLVFFFAPLPLSSASFAHLMSLLPLDHDFFPPSASVSYEGLDLKVCEIPITWRHRQLLQVSVWW